MSEKFEGKNVEEALEAAESALGVQRSELTHRVLAEKRGFLGGVKRVTIEVDVNSVPAHPAAEALAPSEPPPSTTSDEGSGAVSRAASSEDQRGARGRSSEGGRRGGRSRGRGRSGGRGRGGRGRSSDLAPGDFAQFMDDVPAQGPESDAARTAREWCERIITLSRLEVAFRSEEREGQILLRLYGPDTRRFLDRNGELLDSLQVLANKALVGRKVESEIELDCEDFKKSRETDLEQQARHAAEQVRGRKGEVLLPAMSPAERRIIHLTLQDDPDVATESRGDGFFKRVAIVPRPADAVAEP